jgi:hypothetical protein
MTAHLTSFSVPRLDPVALLRALSASIAERAG